MPFSVGSYLSEILREFVFNICQTLSMLELFILIPTLLLYFSNNSKLLVGWNNDLISQIGQGLRLYIVGEHGAGNGRQSALPWQNCLGKKLLTLTFIKK